MVALRINKSTPSKKMSFLRAKLKLFFNQLVKPKKSWHMSSTTFFLQKTRRLKSCSVIYCSHEKKKKKSLYDWISFFFLRTHCFGHLNVYARLEYSINIIHRSTGLEYSLNIIYRRLGAATKSNNQQCWIFLNCCFDLD